MSKLDDLTGRRFGKLTVIKRVENYVSPKGKIIPQWMCECDCGNITTANSYNLKKGNTQSCGCMFLDTVSTHNLSNTRIYDIWTGMKQRCYNTNATNYRYYGARGVFVCEEWKTSFETFYNWAMNNGYNDSLTIDRIDSDKGYCPENCRWVGYDIQNNNLKHNTNVTYNEKTQTLVNWCRELDLDYHTVVTRICQLGWSAERALTTPTNRGFSQ